MTDKPRGICPVCKRSIVLRRNDGAIGHHGSDTGVFPPIPCAGWTRPPQQRR